MAAALVPLMVMALIDTSALRSLSPSATREALNARRRDLRKEGDTGSGDLDTTGFRNSILSGQNPDEPSE